MNSRPVGVFMVPSKTQFCRPWRPVIAAMPPPNAIRIPGASTVSPKNEDESRTSGRVSWGCPGFEQLAIPSLFEILNMSVRGRWCNRLVRFPAVSFRYPVRWCRRAICRIGEPLAPETLSSIH